MRILVIILIAIFLLLQYKLWLADNGVFKYAQLKQQIAQQKLENGKLQDRNHALEAEVNDLKSGHTAIEERARNELGMVKEGETFYQIIESNGQIQESLLSGKTHAGIQK